MLDENHQTNKRKVTLISDLIQHKTSFICNKSIIRINYINKAYIISLQYDIEIIFANKTNEFKK